MSTPRGGSDTSVTRCCGHLFDKLGTLMPDITRDEMASARQ